MRSSKNDSPYSYAILFVVGLASAFALWARSDQSLTGTFSMDELPVGDGWARPGHSGELMPVVERTSRESQARFARLRAEAQGWFDRQAVGGNKITPLSTGAETHQARLRLIERARHTLLLSAYGVGPDENGRLFMRKLCEKAQQGVAVRLLVDPWGSPEFHRYVNGLQNCGAKAIVFNGGAWGIDKIMFAMHEKLLIADGRWAIVGGSGYMNMYQEAGRDSRVWHDLDALIEGPGACEFHRSYVRNWHDVVMQDIASRDTSAIDGDSGHLRRDQMLRLYGAGGGAIPDCTTNEPRGEKKILALHNRALFNPVHPTENAYVAAGVATDEIAMFYAPYFVPSDRFVELLVNMRRRGITVKVITNSRQTNDADPMGMVTHGLYRKARPLLEAGVEIYFWNGPSTLHRKAGVYDHKWAYIGSDNLDARAIHFNTETIFFTDDRATVDFLHREFELDLALSTRLTLPFMEADMASFSGLVHFLGDVSIGFF